MYTKLTTMKAPQNHLNSDFEKLTGMSFKNARIPMKHKNILFEIFISVYDNFFPKVKLRIKTESLHSPWITKGMTNSSKTKQKLYEKISETENYWDQNSMQFL